MQCQHTLFSSVNRNQSLKPQTSFPYVLKILNKLIKTPLAPQDGLPADRNITKMIRTYHYDHLSI